MKGLELSRAYFEQYGKPMLEQDFPDLLPFLAAGLCGSGSECFGYDDEISRDHDFEPGFCLFLPDESTVSRRDAFLLERAYAKLPKSFRGLERAVLLPVGGARHGVLRSEEFFLRPAGTKDGKLDILQWLSTPEQALAEATNGAIFFDHFGEVSRIREKLEYFPEDVRRKKLAGSLLLMAQAGQYNYTRCIRHGEKGAAQLALGEFVSSTLAVLFLLCRRYRPYYKWVFRALRELELPNWIAEALETLLTTGNSPEEVKQKEHEIERICGTVSEMLRDRQLSAIPDAELERHAYAVNDGIRNAELRNMHILSAV